MAEDTLLNFGSSLVRNLLASAGPSLSGQGIGACRVLRGVYKVVYKDAGALLRAVWTWTTTCQVISLR